MNGLRIESLTAGYSGRKVLDGLSVPQILPGSLVAVVGPNAAGKSTLLKAISGLIRANGSIVLDGEDIAAQPMALRIRNTAYLPQSLPQPTPLVAYEAVISAVHATRPELGKRAADHLVEHIFTDLGIRDLALRRLSEMSGGQRQMIGLAQVMAREPRLMLLDEPTSALDLHWQMDVAAAVRSKANASGAIALIAMHDVNLAVRSCDLVIVLTNGRVLASGAPDDVITADVLRNAYCVEARVERCSRGKPFVVIDGAAKREIAHAPV